MCTSVSERVKRNGSRSSREWSSAVPAEGSTKPSPCARSYGIGVERIFPVHSPMVAKIEVATRGRVRRAKLNYLRKLRGKAARIREKRDFEQKIAKAVADDEANQPAG